MSPTLTTSIRIASAAGALAVASAGCVTPAQHPGQTGAAHTMRPTAAQALEGTIARRVDGLYTAPIAGVALRQALPGLHVATGTWAMRIDVGGRTLRLSPPEGGDITLRLIGLDASRLRVAPDTACESLPGRTRPGHFAWSRTDALLRLQTVRAPCRSDAAVLTAAPWRAAWPTSLNIGNPPASP